MRLTITHNFPEVERQIQRLQADIARQATSRALNRTVEQAKTAMGREIRAEFNMTASTVNQSLRIRRASARGGVLALDAELSSISRPGKRSLNLAHFSARQILKGVSFKIKRGGPRKTIPGAFMINDGKTVMIRKGKARLPIKALQTIDVGQMFNTKRINETVVRVIKQKFPEIFMREAAFYTARFNALGKV